MRCLLITRLFFTVCFAWLCSALSAQHSIAREWNEAALETIGEDLARPHVQARNLFHLSIALYDVWAAYDEEADTYLLGKTVGEYTCPCQAIPVPQNMEAAQREAMSFAAYRLLTARYSNSPNGGAAVTRFQEIMEKHGYDYRNHSSDYASGSPAALGNYLAQCLLQMGNRDGSNEQGNYHSAPMAAANPPLSIALPGNPTLQDPNAWQPLKLKVAIDQDGYRMLECKCGGKPLVELIDSVDPKGRRITATQTFQGRNWGRVQPFALRKYDRTVHRRDGFDYWVYHDPGEGFLPRLNASGGAATADYARNFSLVAAWSAYLNPGDGVQWDVSPRAMGHIQKYPQALADLPAFYDLKTGRDPGKGYEVNPRTGQPYASQLVSRADFIRSAVQFWSEGARRETPPGQWFSLLNYVSDRPELVKKFNGKGRLMSDLEWEVKAYFVLGGALHDAAIAVWGSKALYNGTRPVSAIRHLVALGQSSDPKLPSYHPAGISLIPGQIELVKKGDPLASRKNENAGKIKIRAWTGPFAESDTTVRIPAVDWILAENWFPYQVKNHITPPYAGYVSAHAAFARSAAEALALLTGDEYFPGGLGAFTVGAGTGLAGFEKGPDKEVTLQWATYRDAADQAALSRIWAGTNAPFDDIPGRIIGEKTGVAAFQFAKGYFYRDHDRDGYLSYADCDDNNPAVYPGAPEKCDGLDNDCNGKTDDGIPCPGGN